MLITFKSKAAAEVIMYKEHAKRILDLFGKEVDRGIITAGEAAEAVAKLEAEIADARAHEASEEIKHDIAVHHNAVRDDAEHEPTEEVGFATRAFPVLEMLRAADKAKEDVMWGV